MAVALVILAAGASRRLGSCKALVDLGGRTPMERLLGEGACIDGAAALVIGGAHHGQIAVAAPRGVEVVENTNWTEGRTGSVILAGASRPGMDLLLAPVDVPLVPSEVFEALLAAWKTEGSPPEGWLAPTTARETGDDGGRRMGHPVIVGRDLIAGLADFGPDRPLRQLRRRARPLWPVSVESTAIHDDLDTPADLERLRERLASRPR